MSAGPETPLTALPADRLLVNLASERLGATLVYANDEFFAPAAALLRVEPPVWREGEYTDRGKWMDGWETRRRREPGHDECVVRFGAPGRVHEIVVDTTHFRGNQPESCSVEGASAPPGTGDGVPEGPWTGLLARRELGPDARHRFPVAASPRVTHVRLRIFPDGGVARLRVLGRVEADRESFEGAGPVDLAALVHGGLPIAVSDATFGEPRNLLLPGEPRNMGEGWETRRRRGQGHDSVVIALGHRGTIEHLELSTRHFKGNYPAAASADVYDAGLPGAPLPPEDAWRRLLDRTELRPDTRHSFADELLTDGPATHVRLHIHPDGGVARFRVLGRATAAP